MSYDLKRLPIGRSILSGLGLREGNLGGIFRIKEILSIFALIATDVDCYNKELNKIRYGTY